ncbi:MAG: VanW family protein [Armatimonadaceae bacterium]
MQNKTDFSSERYHQTVVFSPVAEEREKDAKTLSPVADVRGGDNRGARRGMSAVGVIIATVLTLSLGGASVYGGVRVASGVTQSSDAAHILPGVKIAEIPVGELTREEAAEKVRAWAREQMLKPVSFFAPVTGRAWNPTLAMVGGRFNVDAALDEAFAVGRNDSFWFHLLNAGKERDVNITVPFVLNTDLLNKQLDKIAQDVYRAPKNAVPKVTESGAIAVVSPETKGVRLDKEATKAALLKDGVESLRDGAQTDIVVVEELPTITAADIQKMRHNLGSFNTYYGSSSYNRRINIEKATQAINGTLLAPGQVFSFNEVVGPRTRNLGWRDAPTFQDGQVVPGVGGGICQVSTTLYNASLKANLKIVARNSHSMPVNYVPRGRDAAVAYGSIDYKFQNSTEGPLLLLGQTKGGRVIFTLFGTKPGKQVEIVSGGQRSNKKGGVNVSTYRVIKEADGTTRREYLGTSSYRPHP